jgi:uncharacterized membrane protein YgdD (TMEM256/DUF423 family)
MACRLWLFLAGLSGFLAVLAASFGAHRLASLPNAAAVTAIWQTGNQFHLVHSLALLLIAALLTASEGRRSALASWLLNLAGFGFLAGIVLFSGGVYLQSLRGAPAGIPIVPAGGLSFLAGWAALALSAFGLRSGRAG